MKNLLFFPFFMLAMAFSMPSFAERPDLDDEEILCERSDLDDLELTT